MPVFVFGWLSSQYGVPSLIQVAAWELLLNLQLYRGAHLEVELFARFLSEHLNADDMLFFLYTRSLVQAELAKQPRGPGSAGASAGSSSSSSSSSAAAAASPPVYLSATACLRVTRTVFGDKPTLFFNGFMELVDAHLEDPPRAHGRSRQAVVGPADRRIEVIKFLYLAVNEYRASRPVDDSLELDGDERALLASGDAVRPAPALESTAGQRRAESVPREREELHDVVLDLVGPVGKEYIEVCLAAAEDGSPLPPLARDQLLIDAERALVRATHPILLTLMSPSEPERQPHTHTSQCNSYVDGLRARYAALDAEAKERFVSPDRVRALVKAILATPDIRHAVEPLVALLVTAARPADKGDPVDTLERLGLVEPPEEGGQDEDQGGRDGEGEGERAEDHDAE